MSSFYFMYDNGKKPYRTQLNLISTQTLLQGAWLWTWGKSSLKGLSYMFAECEQHWAKVPRPSSIQIENDLTCHLVWFSSLFLADIRYSASHVATKEARTRTLAHLQRGPCERDRAMLHAEGSCGLAAPAGATTGWARCLVQGKFGPRVWSRESQAITV